MNSTKVKRLVELTTQQWKQLRNAAEEMDIKIPFKEYGKELVNSKPAAPSKEEMAPIFVRLYQYWNLEYWWDKMKTRDEGLKMLQEFSDESALGMICTLMVDRTRIFSS